MTDVVTSVSYSITSFLCFYAPVRNSVSKHLLSVVLLKDS